jgi:hypothetical protein
VGLLERRFGAVWCPAFADGRVIDTPEAMTVANIAPFPMELVPPIPEPQAYLHHYVMESQSYQGKAVLRGNRKLL